MKSLRFKTLCSAGDPRAAPYLRELSQDEEFRSSQIASLVLFVSGEIETRPGTVPAEIVELTIEMGETRAESLNDDGLFMISLAKLWQHNGNLTRALELAETSAQAVGDRIMPYHRQYIRQLKNEIRKKSPK
jgi:hypothetical protein